MNKSLFDYHHAMDSEVIDQAYKNCKSSSHNLDVSQITYTQITSYMIDQAYKN